MENEVGKTGEGGPENRQVYNIVIGKDPSWQAIIYELVTSEQLDPWNIDITLLCRSYMDRIKELEQSNFHISSKMLLAAALLLRIKSEILLNKYIREIDDILFPRNDDIRKVIERIEIDENDIPILSPKSPMPRFKKVTLQELIDALDVAIRTEGRRIQKEIDKKQAERMSHVDIPKFRRVNIKERIRQFYAKVLTGFKTKKGEMKLPYSHFTGNNKEERIACFLPMLYLSNNGKIWLEQEQHYQEIYMYLYEIFIKQFPEHDRVLMEEGDEKLEEIPAEMMEKLEEFEEVVEELENKIEKEILDEKDDKVRNVKKVNRDFENPIGDLINEESEFSK
jgi:segregation and condensation protein A